MDTNNDDASPEAASGQPRHPDTGPDEVTSGRRGLSAGKAIAVVLGVALVVVIVVLHLTGVIGAESH